MRITMMLILLGSFLFAKEPNIALKIFMNETGGKMENVLSWSKNESFANLGIGHFIWYGNHREIYEETFPDFITYVQFLDPSLKIPKLLTYKKCPWESKEEFDKMKKSKTGRKLVKFLLNHEVVQHQMNFMVEKLKLISNNLSQEESLQFIKKFKKIHETDNGVFALLDYTNFKGFGTNPNERYNNQGWGLYQVFQEIEFNDRFKNNPVIVFKEKCRLVLLRRIKNNPIDKKYRKGWLKRINKY